jgi:hypothetical protein
LEKENIVKANKGNRSYSNILMGKKKKGLRIKGTISFKYNVRLFMKTSKRKYLEYIFDDHKADNSIILKTQQPSQ